MPDIGRRLTCLARILVGVTLLILVLSTVDLHARNDKSEEVIRIGNDEILSNNVMISCKNGTAHIGPNVGLGTQTVIHSVAGCPAKIGADVMVGPQCYLVGGSNYNIDRLDMPMGQQGIREDAGGP